MRLKALVTGSGVRLGQAIALRLAESGFDLALHYHRSEDGVRDTLAGCHGRQARAVALRADLSDPARVKELCQAALTELGGLDLLVNGAAIFFPTSDLSQDWAAWDTFLNLNLRAAFLTVLHCRSALEAAAGSVVNLADIYAEKPLKNHLAYCVSKAGLLGLTRSLALELAPRVRVNAVSPGAILPPAGAPQDTAARLAAVIPLQRLGTPEDIADAVLFLARSPFITGQVLRVDGGRMLNLLDRPQSVQVIGDGQGG